MSPLASHRGGGTRLHRYTGEPEWGPNSCPSQNLQTVYTTISAYFTLKLLFHQLEVFLSGTLSVMVLSSTDSHSDNDVESNGQRPNGCSLIAMFNAVEPDSMKYQTFGRVHSRLLLHLQTSIHALEAELAKKDCLHSTYGGNQSQRSRSCYSGDVSCKEEKISGQRTREDIFEELRVKICQYGWFYLEEAIAR